MRYLLDTMVLSEGFKRRPDQKVLEFLTRAPESDLRISVVSIGEVSRGVRKLEAQNRAEAALFEEWLLQTIADYQDRTLPLTTAIMRRWGPLTYDLRHTNPDTLLAATALEHDLTLVTRNVRHFEPTGVRLFNPYR